LIFLLIFVVFEGKMSVLRNVTNKTVDPGLTKKTSFSSEFRAWHRRSAKASYPIISTKATLYWRWVGLHEAPSKVKFCSLMILYNKETERL
jgi:hypothetical protein